MRFLLLHCPHCKGGNLYQEEDGTVTCLACAHQFNEDLTPFRRLPSSEPYHYQLLFKAPTVDASDFEDASDLEAQSDS